MPDLDADPVLIPPVPTLTVDAAFDRYEAIRPRLPQAGPPVESREAPDLISIAERYDGFLFDSFGVLNVGETAIPGAAACLEALRDMGKRICILTNAASYTSAEAHRKYERLGLDIRPEEIVSSRDVSFAHLTRRWPGLTWAAIAAEGDDFADAGAEVADLLSDERLWDTADGFLFLSSVRWSQLLQDRLLAALEARPRPLVVGNPDLVAPRETGLTIEPGYWAHDIQDRCGQAPVFYGKPFGEAFQLSSERLGGGRLAMVGDTLHTDILGGQDAGFDTILVTDHGLFAGRSEKPFMERSRIMPDWVIPAI